jgi:hypothetical protein
MALAFKKAPVWELSIWDEKTAKKIGLRTRGFNADSVRR